MKARKLPTREQLLDKFIYSRGEGKIFYRKTKKEAVGSNGIGYITANFTKKPNRRSLLVHRIIYFLETGEQPEIVDHIDRDVKNNHISNLRSSTKQLNAANASFSKKTSVYKGVFFRKDRGTWVAKIKVNQKNIFLGSFYEEKEAAKVYNDAVTKYFGEYACLNIIENE